jgi:AAA ATPase domain
MAANQLLQTAAPLLMLERRAELAVLEAMLDAAHGGDGRLVVVEGSAGIGKMRLLAEARVPGGGVRYIGRPRGQLEGEFAFGIVRQPFEGPLAAARPDIRAELLTGAATLATPLLAAAPESATRDGAEPSFAMLHGLYWLAANFASRAPTLLVVDDLHHYSSDSSAVCLNGGRWPRVARPGRGGTPGRVRGGAAPHCAPGESPAVRWPVG